MEEKIDYDDFIKNKVSEIKEKVDENIAINALSGGVDSSVVTALAKKAIGDKLVTYFIDTGFMRENEPERVINTFRKIGVDVKLYDASDEFLDAVKGLTDGEEKRKAFSNTFYKVFGRLIKEEGAKFLFQGTIKADKIMFKKGQSQHNVRTASEYEKFGIKGVIEPLEDLYKPDVRIVGEKLGLPKEIFKRQPFPGPGLLVRVIGEATRERVDIVRKAQKIVEEELNEYNPSQCLACLANDTATGMIGGKAPGKNIILVRAIKTKDFMTAKVLWPEKETMEKIRKRIAEKVPNVGRILYEITGKPPATIEYI
jgi:GMP synthase (glutamine-hydrolysing)